MSNKLKMINSKFKKRVCIFLWLIALISYVAWRPQLVFAVKAVSGVVPNPPPLFQVDVGVSPNVSGSIQNSGRAVLPGEEGSGVGDSNGPGDTQQESSQGTASAKSTSLGGGTSFVWWLVILALCLVSYFGYKRWRRN